MRKPVYLIGTAITVVLVLGGAQVIRTVLSPDPAAAGQLLPYTDTDAVALGEQLYTENCSSCHGANLEGEADWRGRDDDGYLRAPPHDASGHTWHHADTLLIDITTRGSAEVVGGGYQSRMPGFSDVLTEAQILAVLAYIKSTWPDEIIEAHDELNRRLATQ